MAWTQTQSLSFAARHEEGDESCAERILDQLEDLHLRLEESFEVVPGGITIVIHPSAGWLAAAHPFLPVLRLAAAPAARRYLAGWPTVAELHTLNDSALEARAGGPDSLRALQGTAARLYAQVVLAANLDEAPPPWGPRSLRRYVQWAWLIEGASQYFSRQVASFRPAVGRRLADGPTPSFPPAARDAIILGGTVFDLLDRMVGLHACQLLASRLRKDGSSQAIEVAFGESLGVVEREWRDYLAGLRQAG